MHFEVSKWSGVSFRCVSDCGGRAETSRLLPWIVMLSRLAYVTRQLGGQSILPGNSVAIAMSSAERVGTTQIDAFRCLNTFSMLGPTMRLFATAAKIKVTEPVVDLDGDEMTRSSFLLRDRHYVILTRRCS